MKSPYKRHRNSPIRPQKELMKSLSYSWSWNCPSHAVHIWQEFFICYQADWNALVALTSSLWPGGKGRKVSSHRVFINWHPDFFLEPFRPFLFVSCSVSSPPSQPTRKNRRKVGNRDRKTEDELGIFSSSRRNMLCLWCYFLYRKECGWDECLGGGLLRIITCSPSLSCKGLIRSRERDSCLWWRGGSCGCWEGPKTPKTGAGMN